MFYKAINCTLCLSNIFLVTHQYITELMISRCNNLFMYCVTWFYLQLILNIMISTLILFVILFKSTLLSDANHGYNIFQKYNQRLKSRKSNQLERGNLAASDSRPISNYLRFRKDSYTRVRLRRDSSPSLYWKKKVS